MTQQPIIFCTVLFLLLKVTPTFAQSQKDADAIKSMCGCFDVTFNYAETFSNDTAYTPKYSKAIKAVEYVIAIEDKPGHIILQHILDAGDGGIIKHWRQDWDYENTSLYDFLGDNKWKTYETVQDKTAGQWSQKVYEVDDSPRYSATGTWIHSDGKTYWETTCNAPLARRDYTKRSDYNLLRRRNRHEITTYGWLHEQDNEKILKTDSTQKVLVAEKGWNTYKKINASECEKAATWWKQNAAFWALVRKVWQQELAGRNEWKLDRKLDDHKLFDNLIALSKKEMVEASEEETAIRTAIQAYLR